MDNENLIRLRSEEYRQWLMRQEGCIAIAIAYIDSLHKKYSHAIEIKNWNKANDCLFEIAAAKMTIKNLGAKGKAK